MKYKEFITLSQGILTKKFITSSIFFAACSLQAEVAHGVLEKYPNKVFVGTGIYSSINIGRALNANFPAIYCMDADQVLVDHARTIVPSYIHEKPRKHLKSWRAIHGDPKKDLLYLINSIHTPITFLLSSHFPDVDDQTKQNDVLFELNQIKQHPIKTHTILIEYIHWAGTPFFGGITLQMIKDKLLEINPRYSFTFETGGHLEEETNAILVAYIKEINR